MKAMMEEQSNKMRADKEELEAKLKEREGLGSSNGAFTLPPAFGVPENTQ